MNKKMIRRQVICFMLCLAVVLSGIMLPANKVKAEENEIVYYDWDEASKALIQKTISEELCTVVTASTTAMTGAEGGSWYIVNSDITISERISVQGEVHLILADNVKFTASKGISVNKADDHENKLYIYAQSSDEATMGTLVAKGEADITGWSKAAAIGGDDGKTAGAITINGGIIDARASYAAAIGGGQNADGGIITINGGKIDAYGEYGATIGGGYNNFTDTDPNYGNGGNITINGGTITVSNSYMGAGIGGGHYGNGGNITINGGTIEIEAENGAGIGSGASKSTSSGDSRLADKNGGNIIINGGTITVDTIYGAGIGGGMYCHGGNITVNGGSITATNDYQAAGIGGGLSGNSGTITITDGMIDSQADYGAGIGGGYKGSGENIRITGGTVKAEGYYGAGIGGGEKGKSGNLTIEGGVITAKSNSGPGIGSGYNSNDVTVTISGGMITATSLYGAGIGGGQIGEGEGTVTISGGTIVADSNQGAAIGSGRDSEGVEVAIEGGNIKATSTYGDRIGNGLGKKETDSDMYAGIRTITLCGMTEQTAIDSAVGMGNYGLTDVETLDNNKLYFYLPESTALSSITANDVEYIGKVNDDEMEATFHNCIYTKEADNKLVAVCTTENCVSYEISMAKPTDTTYTGNAVEPQVTVIPANSFAPEIKYVANTGSLTDGKPVNAGNYTASITLGGETVSVTFDITKPEDPGETPDTPTETPGPEKALPEATVAYRTHVQSIGWQEYVTDGVMAGTSGISKRLEGIEIFVGSAEEGKEVDLGIQYTTHCQSYGWLPWSADGDMNGTEGEAKRLEAIMIKLTGEDAEHYDVYYRVHAQSYGWLSWAKDGAPAGTAGYGKRLEGIQIVVVKKDATFDKEMGGIKSVKDNAFEAKAGDSPIVNYPATSNTAPVVPGDDMVNVTYRTHVQKYGWQAWKYNGQMSGTSGEAKRLEGIEIKLTNKDYDGGIAYCTHVQTYVWQGANLDDPSTWKKDGQMAGTSGEAKRLEAICIALTGEMADHYDIYYRVHAQSYGWLGWAKNGEASGTAGYAKRLEGIQIVLVPKGGAAPANNYGGITSNNDKPYIQK